MSDLKFYVKMIGGGLGCFVLGGLLLSMPGVEWWRAIAAFPLGLVLIALGVMYWRREQSNDHE
jgi:membrane protein implicated in regulation of membrane protease activity